MDPIVLIVLAIALAASMVYVFFFVEETSAEQEEINRAWMLTAEEFGLNCLPFTGDRFEISIKGEHDGIPIQVTIEARNRESKEVRVPGKPASLLLLGAAGMAGRSKSRRRRRRQRERLADSHQPTTVFRVQLNRLWPESVLIGKMLPSDHKEVDISLGDPEFDAQILVTGIPNEELKEVLSTPEIREALHQGCSRFQWFRIKDREINLLYPGGVTDENMMIEAGNFLFPLAKLLNQAAIDGSPFEDERYQKSDEVAPEPVTAENPW